MKKIISLFLIVTMLISMTSCIVIQTDDKKADGNKVETTSAKEEAKAESTSQDKADNAENTSQAKPSQDETQSVSQNQNDGEEDDPKDDPELSEDDIRAFQQARDDYEDDVEQDNDRTAGEREENQRRAWRDEMIQRNNRGKSVIGELEANMDRSRLDRTRENASEIEKAKIAKFNESLMEKIAKKKPNGDKLKTIAQINAERIAAGKGGLLAGQREAWSSGDEGEAYPVNTSETSIPVVGNIGRGYNVFGEYASANALKSPVLDLQKLVRDNMLERKRIDDSDYSDVVGSSARNYSKNLSTNTGLGISYGAFQLGFNADYNNGEDVDEDRYYGKVSYLIKKYDIYVKPASAQELKPYMTDDFKEMINSNAMPTKVFEAYGHYVLLDAITGGRLDFIISKRKTDTTTYTDFKSGIGLSFKAFNLGFKGHTKDKLKEFFSDADVSLKTTGGKPLDLRTYENDENALEDWANSIYAEGDELDRANIIEFGTTRGSIKGALVPVWEFADSPERRELLKESFKGKRYRLDSKIFPNDKYIDAITVVDASSYSEAIAKKPKGEGWYILSDPNQNLNAMYDGAEPRRSIFICYHLSKKSKNAITDLLVEIRSDRREDWSPRTLSNNEFGASEYFPVSQLDLNRYHRGEFIYLWYTKTKHTGMHPLVDLDVRLGEPDDRSIGDWEYVKENNATIPANFNEGAYGEYVKVLYLRDQK